MDNSAVVKPVGFSYPRGAAGYDEVYGSQLQMQKHWQHLFDGLQALGDQGIQERQMKAERILRDDGATYNSGASPFSNIWQLDPVIVVKKAAKMPPRLSFTPQKRRRNRHSRRFRRWVAMAISMNFPRDVFYAMPSFMKSARVLRKFAAC